MLELDKSMRSRFVPNITFHLALGKARRIHAERERRAKICFCGATLGQLATKVAAFLGKWVPN
jgi:hypothetical protein